MASSKHPFPMRMRERAGEVRSETRQSKKRTPQHSERGVGAGLEQRSDALDVAVEARGDESRKTARKIKKTEK
jgi:hypothetical protein